MISFNSYNYQSITLNMKKTNQHKYHIKKRQITKKGKQRDEIDHWTKYMVVTLHKNHKDITKDELNKAKKYFGLDIFLNDLLRIILEYVNFAQQKSVCLESSKKNVFQRLLFSNNVEICTVFKNCKKETKRFEYVDFNKTITFKGVVTGNNIVYEKCTSTNTKIMDDYLKNESTEHGKCNGNHTQDWPCSELLEDLENIKNGNKKYVKSWFAKIYEIFIVSKIGSQTMNSVKNCLEKNIFSYTQRINIDVDNALITIGATAKPNDIILVTNNDTDRLEVSLLTHEDLNNIVREMTYIYYTKNILQDDKNP